MLAVGLTKKNGVVQPSNFKDLDICDVKKSWFEVEPLRHVSESQERGTIIGEKSLKPPTSWVCVYLYVCVCVYKYTVYIILMYIYIYIYYIIYTEVSHNGGTPSHHECQYSNGHP